MQLHKEREMKEHSKASLQSNIKLALYNMLLHAATERFECICDAVRHERSSRSAEVVTTHARLQLELHEIVLLQAVR